jgi:phage shock protein PspC (stress-responsive transcriptional regulator)
MYYRKTQLACVWSLAVVGVLMFGGWWTVAQFVPPHLPAASAEEIAAIYRANATNIRIGMVMVMFAGAFVGPFTAVAYMQMKRIEGKAFPILSLSWLVCGTWNIPGLTIPAMLWTVAAFRPERDPQITQVFNDLGWLFFIMVNAVPVLQAVLFGLVILGDKAPKPLFPRWFGYLNLWMAVLFFPAALITFFKTGPFAWNGLISFWMIVVVVGAEMLVLMVYLLKAINREDYEGK